MPLKPLRGKASKRVPRYGFALRMNQAEGSNPTPLISRGRKRLRPGSSDEQSEDREPASLRAR